MTARSSKTAIKDEEIVRLEVILLEQGCDSVEFCHLGTRFKATNDSVVDIGPCLSAIPNSWGRGTPQTIALRSDADLVPALTIKVRDLLREVPFAVSRPSLIREFGISSLKDDLAEERQWLIDQGIELVDETTMTTYTRTDSSRSTESKSGGVIDDQNSDSMTNDDANPTD